MRRRRLLFFSCIGLALVSVVVALLAALPTIRQIIYQRGVLQWDGKSNHSVRFFGRVVDQDGTAITGATITARVTQMNAQFAPTSSRGRSTEIKLTATTNLNGEFSLDVRGMILEIDAVWVRSYRLVVSGSRGVSEETDGRNYGVQDYPIGTLGGQQLYFPDPSNPAVFVMLREDAAPVSHVMMSRGGWQFVNYNRRMRNEPFWPHKTSPAGVVYQPPATQP